MANKKKEVLQQGDVILVPEGVGIPELGISDGWKKPKGCELKSTNVAVLAEGEVTGHSHRFMPDQLDGSTQLEQKEQMVYLTTITGGVVKHEEHHPINVPAGTYQILITREFDHLDEEARRVAD